MFGKLWRECSPMCSVCAQEFRPALRRFRQEGLRVGELDTAVVTALA